MRQSLVFHRRERTRAALALVGVLAIGAVLFVTWRYAPAFGLDNTVRGTEELIRSWGAWGVLGSLGLMVAHSFLPFPAEIVALANGMVYGPFWGALITWSGAMLGALCAFAFARWLGQPFVRRVLSPDRYRRVAAWSRSRGGVALFIGRLIPVISFNLINYAAALTEISWWTFLWATALGILPLTIVLAVLGQDVLALPAWSWLILGVAAVLGWVILKARPRARAQPRPLGDARDSPDG